MIEQWKIDVFRDKLRHSLSARFFLRFHIGLILFLTVLTGWLVDAALFKLGLQAMGARYFLAIMAAYGGFLLGVYLWIEYSGIKQYIERRNANKLIGDNVPAEPGKISSDWSGLELLDPTGCMINEGCSTVFFLVVAAVVGFYFFGGYFFLNAADLFIEVVLELLLAAGLLRGIRKVEASGWMLGVWRTTWPSLVFSLFVTALLVAVAHDTYPTANTLPELLSHMRQK